MILHIVPDDKFIDMAYEIFELACPNNNEFMVITNKEKIKYIKTTPIAKISKKGLLRKKSIKDLEKYEFIILHTLSDIVKKVILNANKNTKFIWIGWGFDYYCYLNKTLLFNKTLKLKEELVDNNGFKRRNILRLIKYFIKYNTINKNLDAIFDKIDYFAPVLYEDYELVQNNFKNFNPKYLDWNYGTLEDDFVKEELNISGENILLGNSASYENNHIEAIDLLSSLDLKNRRIICPLSYGSERYAQEIINYGQKILNNKFSPLVKFIEIDEYNKIISTCSIVIMNHLRQQALGNIIIMLYFGAKIFLNKQNPVYNYLKNNGAMIFSMDQLTNENIHTMLGDKEKLINKKVLEKYWSKEIMLTKTKNLIETMRNI